MLLLYLPVPTGTAAIVMAPVVGQTLKGHGRDQTLKGHATSQAATAARRVGQARAYATPRQTFQGPSSAMTF